MGLGAKSGSKQMNLICIIIMACENESVYVRIRGFQGGPGG